MGLTPKVLGDRSATGYRVGCEFGLGGGTCAGWDRTV